MSADGRRQAVEQFRRGRDPIAQRDGAAEVERLDPRAEPRLELAPQPIGGVRSAQRRARQHDAGETAAAQPILVIHRGLVHQIRQIVVVLGRTRAEENHVAIRAPPPSCCSRPRRGRAASRLPACCAPSAPSTALTRLTRRQIDDARVRARRLARALVALDDVAARDGHDVLPAAFGQARCPGTQDTCASSILNGAAFRTCQRIS